MKLIYPAVFSPCLEKEGYTVTIPDLPGCVTEGDSLLHAIEMGIDAASGWILGELEEGKPIPEPTPREHFVTDHDCFINDLVLDIDAYAENTVKKRFERTLPFRHGSILLANRTTLTSQKYCKMHYWKRHSQITNN